MARTTRLFRSITALVFPIIVLVVIAIAAGSVWLVYKAAHPASTKYVLTPDKYGRLSSRAAQVTDETWTNKDGSTSRGWLLRGNENSPAVILLHRYGADRSHVLDLGVKLNESTNFTVLMPDLRAHGEAPDGKICTFGGCGADDAAAAIEFLRSLRTPTQIALVGKEIGIYGIELGAIQAITVAAEDNNVKAMVLDSVPADSDALLSQTVERRYPFMSALTTRLARLGTYLYFYDGCYHRGTMCDAAKKIEDRHVLLLAGLDSAANQDSTGSLAKCFPGTTKVEAKLDLSPSGFSILNASLEQSESYDQRVIEFFRNALPN